MVAMSVRLHLGNEGLKSGKDVTPGQSCSVGVPRTLFRISDDIAHDQDLHLPEDLENLVDFRVAWEERLAGAHLGEDAAYRPHIDAGGVLTTSKENLRSAVP